MLMLKCAVLQHRVDLSVGLVGEHERVERWTSVVLNRLD